MLIAFILLALGEARLFKLKGEFVFYWSIARAWYIVPAFLCGVVIAALPVISAVFSGTPFVGIQYNYAVTWSGALATLVIVSWEEAWFRGVILNYCSRHLSTINISLTVGFLFMLLHVLNPQISLVKTGPTLFFAGALLTIVYFYFGSIWAPIGLHFGNNLANKMLMTKLDDDLFFGNDGYFSAILLAALTGYFFWKVNKIERQKLKAKSYRPL